MSIQSRERQRIRDEQAGRKKPLFGAKKKVRGEAYKPTPLDITKLQAESHKANLSVPNPRSRKYGSRGAFGNPLLTSQQRMEKSMRRTATKHLAGAMNEGKLPLLAPKKTKEQSSD